MSNALPHKSLKTIEREQKREVSRARRWLSHHDVGALPGRRLENGESASKERSSMFTGPGQGTELRASSARGIVSIYQHDGSFEDWERAQHGRRSQYIAEQTSPTGRRLQNLGAISRARWDEGLYEPLVGRLPGQPNHVTKDDLERRDRLEHVMSFLLPEHAELLLERHAERRTLDAIAKDRCVTRQAIIKRLRTAEQDFRKHFGERFNDPLGTP